MSGGIIERALTDLNPGTHNAFVANMGFVLPQTEIASLPTGEKSPATNL